MRIIIISAIAFLAGCSTTNHSVQATLYEESSPGSPIYNFVPYSGNPVFVDENSVFELRIEEIMPGWIHQGVSQDKPLEQHNQDPECVNETKGGSPCSYTSWTDEIADQLYGKELWIVSKIESVNKNDILERNSKIYFHATNVKLNSFSFKPIPLDIEELNLFSHSSDSAYRVTIKVYEVQGFDVKREALKAYDNNPGIAGLFVSGWQVVKNTVGALAGELIESQWKTKNEEAQFIERLLLENGAVVEFQGVLHVLRSKGVLDPVSGPVGRVQDYLLYDPYKSEDFDSSFKSKDEYKAALLKLEAPVDLNVANTERTYLKFTVQQSLEDVSSIPAAAVPLPGYTEAIEFLDSVRLD